MVFRTIDNIHVNIEALSRFTWHNGRLHISYANGKEDYFTDTHQEKYKKLCNAIGVNSAFEEPNGDIESMLKEKDELIERLTYNLQCAMEDTRDTEADCDATLREIFRRLKERFAADETISGTVLREYVEELEKGWVQNG